MNLGVIVIDKGGVIGQPHQNIDYSNLSGKVFSLGLRMEFLLVIDDENALINYQTAFDSVEYLLVYGGKTVKQFFGAQPESDRLEQTRKNIYFLDLQQNLSTAFEAIMPTIAAKIKTTYFTITIKTFNLKAREIAKMIKDLFNNKKRIIISLIPGVYECDVKIRYSSAATKVDVDYIFDACVSRLKYNIYAIGDTTLEKEIITKLTERGKRVAIAESYTGGAVTAALTKVAGASKVIVEGIVSYSEFAKQVRLNVTPQTISQHTSVSLETVYSMASGLFMPYAPIDYVVATTGYAGPAGEDVGKCFHAVGDKKAIHLFEYSFGGTREQVIELGAKRALIELYKLVTDTFESQS